MAGFHNCLRDCWSPGGGWGGTCLEWNNSAGSLSVAAIKSYVAVCFCLEGPYLPASRRDQDPHPATLLAVGASYLDGESKNGVHARLSRLVCLYWRACVRACRVTGDPERYTSYLRSL